MIALASVCEWIRVVLHKRTYELSWGARLRVIQSSFVSRYVIPTVKNCAFHWVQSHNRYVRWYTLFICCVRNLVQHGHERVTPCFGVAWEKSCTADHLLWYGLDGAPLENTIYKKGSCVSYVTTCTELIKRRNKDIAHVAWYELLGKSWYNESNAQHVCIRAVGSFVWTQ